MVQVELQDLDMAKIKKDPQKYRPIANHGHPDLNPDSVQYQEYWSRETDRCINGFKPKGMKKIECVKCR